MHGIHGGQCDGLYIGYLLHVRHPCNVTCVVYWDDYDFFFYLYDNILSLHTGGYWNHEGMQHMCVHVLVTTSTSYY